MATFELFEHVVDTAGEEDGMEQLRPGEPVIIETNVEVDRGQRAQVLAAGQSDWVVFPEARFGDRWRLEVGVLPQGGAVQAERAEHAGVLQGEVECPERPT